MPEQHLARSPHPINTSCWCGVAAAVLTATDVALGITMATTPSSPEEESPECRSEWVFPALGFTNFYMSWVWDFLNRGLKEDCPLLISMERVHFQCPNKDTGEKTYRLLSPSVHKIKDIWTLKQ